MLLAAYPEWQARARAEVLDVCGSELPNDSGFLTCMHIWLAADNDHP